jgi:hypothetical protein
MSNTLFRKGLVAAAIVALGSAGIAAVPAQAASVLFAPTTGTGNTLVAGETFSLTASLSSDLPAANSTQLKFKVTNTTGVAATVKLNSTTLTTSNHVQLDASVGGGFTATALSSTAASNTVFGLGNVSNVSVATNPTSIQIVSTAATTADYTVTAWLDANNNGVVDNGELSAAQTVHFVKIANSGITTTFTKPGINSNALSSTISFGADVNVQQLTAANYTVAYALYGVSGRGSATAANNFSVPGTYDSLTGTDAVSAYDATNYPGIFRSSSTTTTSAATAGATYSAQAVFGGALVGNEAVQVVAASADADPYALTVSATTGDNVAGSAGSYTVRTGVLSTSVKTTIKKTPAGTTVTSTSGVAVGAGVAVKVTVSGLTLGHNTDSSVFDTMTVAGAAVTAANAGTFSTTVTTAADGTVTVPVVVSNGFANTAVTVILTVPNASSVVTGNAALTWTAATVGNATRVAVGSAAVSIAKAGNINLQYALKDSYGALVTTGAYQLIVTAPGTGTGAVSNTVYVPFVNGIANVTVADGSTAVGSYNVAVTQQVQTAGLWGSNSSLTAVAVNVVAAQTASAVSAAINAGANLGSASNQLLPLDVAGVYVTGNRDVTPNTVAAPGSTSGSETSVSGTVTDASGVGVAGAQVTVAVPGAELRSGNAYGVGTLTVTADAAGAYTVYIATHTAGTSTVTVTSGAATKTASLYVAAAAANTTGKTLTVVTSPANGQALPGSSVSVTAKLVDAYGNPVAASSSYFKFALSGIGATQTVTATAADGTATINVTLGAGDLGTLTATATYDVNGAVATATAPVVATGKIVVAAPAAAKNTVAVAASQAQVGAAVDVTATAVDAAGKPAAGVVVSFTVAGQGYLSTASATTNAAGVATVKLVSNVAGMNTVSAAANGVATAATAAVTFGNADANLTFSSKNRRATATYEFAGNAKVVISVNGVRVKTLYPADDMVGSYSVSLKKGKNKVSVSVAGVTTDSHTVTTK